MNGRGFTERDNTSVYFWSVGTYFVYNAIISKKKMHKRTLFTF